ncbi:MAG: hypothetical protein R3F34_05365 [Planctomycetota bacterium]
MTELRCESCTMPIESGHYCRHCADEGGALRSFEETFERFRQWTAKREPGLTEEESRARVLAFMASVPAWRDHPEVARGKS